VQDEVTIQFGRNSEFVNVTAETRFEMKATTPEIEKRVDAARDAAQHSLDAWSARFSRLTPESETVTMRRERGTLERVTRTVVIPTDDLPRIFSDCAFTVFAKHGELTFYPGTSTRATREQQRRFDEELDAWSGDVTRYFRAVRVLYRYLDAQPARAKEIFAALIAGKEEEAPLPEEEQPLVQAVLDAEEKVAERMDAQTGRAESFAEMADLIYNPFPARMVVRLPNAPYAVEGFTKANNDVVIEPVDLLKVVSSLEGRWISPDPLANLIREEIPTAYQLAAMPRKAEPVSSTSDVAAALREQLVRPRVYTVRWRD
jgi:hypothetical protein